MSKSRTLYRSLRSIARKTGYLLSTVLGSLFFALLMVEIWRTDILIEPFVVPEKLHELGYKSVVVSQLFVDEMNEIRKASRASISLTSIGRTWIQPDLVVPVLGLSLKQTVAYVSDLFALEKTVVSGEIMQRNEDENPLYNVILRINGQPEVELRNADLLKDMKTNMRKGAEKILERIGPYELASYYYDSMTNSLYGTSDYLKYRRNVVALLEGITQRNRTRDGAAIGDGYLLYGDLFMYEGDFDMAILKYKTASDYEDTIGKAYINWAVALEKKKQYVEAGQMYLRAIEEERDSARGHVIWANALVRAEEYSCAEEHYRHARAIDDSNLDVYVGLGRMHFKMNKVDKAIEYFEKAMMMRADFAPLYGDIGLALLSIGRSDEAMEHLERSIELKPNQLRAHEELLKLYKMKEMKDKARNMFRRSREIEQDLAQRKSVSDKAPEFSGDCSAEEWTFYAPGS